MTASSRERRAFRLLQLHSATGVLPVGAFLILHLWINARAMQGQEAYQRVVGTLQSTPGLVFLEIVGILVPLAFHAGYGVVLILSGPSKAPPILDEQSWVRPLRRASGLFALAFLAYHLSTLPLRSAIGDLRPDDYFPSLVDTLSATNGLGLPLGAAFYLAGLAATTYHFASGLPPFLRRFDLTTSENALRRAAIGSTVLGLALFLVGASTVIYLATGSVWP